MSDPKPAASLKTITFALMVAMLAAVAAFVFKHRTETHARATLENDYGAVVEQDPISGNWSIALDNPQLRDLGEVGPILKKSGRVVVLDLTGCSELVSTTGIELANQLESIIGFGMPSLQKLEKLDQLPLLREVIFSGCPAIDEVSSLKNLPSLEAIDFSGSFALAGELSLQGLPSLAYLTLSDCHSLESLTLKNLPRLQSLLLDGCSKLKSIQGLASAASLTDIDLSNTHFLQSVAELATLPELHLVDLRNTAAADAITTAGQCHSIKILRLGGQADLTNFQALADLENLTEFHFDASSSLQSLRGLPTENLVYCGVPQCPELTDIGALAGAPELTEIDLSGCTKLADLSPLAGLPKLQGVNLTSCRNVRDISVFAGEEEMIVIQIGGTSVSRPKIAELQKALPQTILDFSEK